jgi:hypothetical protein
LLLLEFGVEFSDVLPLVLPFGCVTLLLLSFKFPLVPVLLFGGVLMLEPLVLVPDWLSNEPPWFSREAQPAANSPAIAVNAINFFILLVLSMSTNFRWMWIRSIRRLPRVLRKISPKGRARRKSHGTLTLSSARERGIPIRTLWQPKM